MWADSSKLTLYAISGYLPSLNPGDHPGWTLLARGWLVLIRFLGAIQALHLLSAVSGALGIALVFTLVTRWTDDMARGHAAATILLVAHSLWWTSSLTESYAPALTLALTALLAAGAPGTLRGLATGIATGLGTAVHPFSLVLSGPLLAVHWKRPSIWGGVLLGSSPIWLGLMGTPADPLTGHSAGGAGTWRWHIQQFLDPHHILMGGLMVLALLAFNLGPVGSWAVVRSLRHSSGHPCPRTAWTVLAGYLLVLCLYSPFRLHLMVGFGISALVLLTGPQLGLPARIGHVIVQATAYLCLPLLLGLVGRGDLGLRQLPERNNAWYFLCPIKNFDHGPERYAHSLLEQAPDNATIISDFNPGAVLALVQRTESLRPDLVILPTVVDETLGGSDPAAALSALILDQIEQGNPVVLADRWEPYYHTSEIERRLPVSLVPCGPGWRIVPESGEQ